MLATVLSRAQVGLDAPEVRIDAHVASGLPSMTIVGLPETSIKESRDRVRAAIQTAQFEFPAGRITINLAPADLPKEGARFDLPIALALLIASGQLPGALLGDCELYGELSLSAEVRSVKGLLPAVFAATKNRRRLIIPKENVPEARLVTGAHIAAVGQLTEISDHLRRVKSLRLIPSVACAPTAPGTKYPDLADVRGQTRARRALEIAAAGQHSMLLVGSPGTGKSMLAERLPGLLPPLSEAEALEVAALTSISTGEFEAHLWRQRPFRAPHHTCSAVALIGGGSRPLPGEISLAHHGVLFLDELPEFDRHALEALREPLESARIVLSRAAHRAEYPARFQLIAAMNPCPCGALDTEGEQCRCTLGEIKRYQGRISGPLLDRLDIHVRMHVVDPAELRCTQMAETSAVIASRVAAARRVQLDRQGQCNAQLDTSRIQQFCALTADAQEILDAAVKRFRLSARVYHRLLKVSRTIADLEGVRRITAAHVSEALLFRPLDLLGSLRPLRDRSYAPSAEIRH